LPFDAMYKGPSSYQYRSNSPDFFVLSSLSGTLKLFDLRVQ
jgi:hypothetical protein